MKDDKILSVIISNPILCGIILLLLAVFSIKYFFSYCKNKNKIPVNLITIVLHIIIVVSFAWGIYESVLGNASANILALVCEMAILVLFIVCSLLTKNVIDGFYVTLMNLGLVFIVLYLLIQIIIIEDKGNKSNYNYYVEKIWSNKRK